MSDERRAEIEAEELATALKQHFAPQDVGYGRMPVTAHAIDLARWFLDRVRDARGDDESYRCSCARIPHAEWCNVLTCAHAARSPQGEDHEPETMFDVEPQSWEETAKSLMREKVERLAQGEDHEVGETAAAKALYPILHAVSRGDSPEALLGHAVRVTLNAYLSRMSPSRDGSVAVEDVAKWMRLEVFGTGRDLAERFLAEFSPASTGDREAPRPGTGHGE